MFATATAIAKKGTPTPLPPNWVTPVVVVSTPTPDDPATATVQAALAKLDAILIGTPTPTPPNVVTATPTSTYVIITSVPRPENISTAMARGLFATATAIAEKGTSTPLPPNWVTPVVVVATPTPDDPATATIQAILAELDAILVGTPTPTPPNVLTATPTPWIAADAVIYPTMTPFTVNPLTVPSAFAQRIGFMSDRDGGERGFYVMDPDGSNVQRLTGSAVYDIAAVWDTLGPLCIPQETGDEWLRGTWLWNEHPSWSADCQRLVFHSDRTGNSQIWIMDFQNTNSWGRNQRNISNNPYNDWNPVWIKPPLLAEATPTPGQSPASP